MENTALHQSIDTICTEFPTATAELEQALHEFYINYRRKIGLQADNRIIVSILKQDYINTASRRAKNNAAQTLKLLAQPSTGQNCDMPHLAHLHPMTRTAHFKTLCTKGLAKRISRGRYELAEKGWQLFELAYKLSVAPPEKDNDLLRFSHVINRGR
jgi:hypothetical protein